MLKPVATTMPYPVRRPSSEAISPVYASEVPCGAATTTPCRPILPEIVPGRPSISPRLALGAHPESTPEAIATLIAHQHRLRERIVTFVGEREQHPRAPLGQTDLPRPARQHERRRLRALAAHLDLAPVHAELESRAERLEGRLLGGEPRREMRGRIRPLAAVRDLVLGEDAAQEAILPA